MEVWRPCDATEVSTAWVAAVENLENPTSLVLSRQGTSFIPRTASSKYLTLEKVAIFYLIAEGKA